MDWLINTAIKHIILTKRILPSCHYVLTIYSVT